MDKHCNIKLSSNNLEFIRKELQRLEALYCKKIASTKELNKIEMYSYKIKYYRFGRDLIPSNKRPRYGKSPYRPVK